MKKLFFLGILFGIGTLLGDPDSLKKGDICRLVAGPDYDASLERWIKIEGTGEEIFNIPTAEALLDGILNIGRPTDNGVHGYAERVIKHYNKSDGGKLRVKKEYEGMFYCGYILGKHYRQTLCLHSSWLEKTNRRR